MFSIEFGTANDVFTGGNYRHEIARILNDVRDKVLDNYSAGVVRDASGNTIGKWTLALPLDQE